MFAESCVQFPSWVHFSAHHGLSALTEALLTVPGWQASVTQANADGLTPDRMAQAQGHARLAERLETLAVSSCHNY